MTAENNEGLPADIDVKKLVVQEGEDKGRIADVELARVGAEREDKERSSHDIRKRLMDAAAQSGEDLSTESKIKQAVNEYADQVGAHAMGWEVGRRTKEHLPSNIGDDLNREVQQAGHDSFIEGLSEKSVEKKAEDAAKAQAIIDKLRGKK